LGNLKTFRVLIVLILALGIFTNSAMAEICFCGETCSHVFPNSAKKKESFPFHSHCPGMNCKSCNFEDGQVLKAKTAPTKALDFTILYTSIFLAALSPYHLNTHRGDGVTSWIYAGLKVQLTPIYLQNQCLLC
jgi:hypothetical protein